MKNNKILFIIIILLVFSAGCSAFFDKGDTIPTDEPPLVSKPESASEGTPDGEGDIYFTVMIHLEGWDDARSEEKFERHAELVREYASLFETYGAVMTLESKEFTDGCIQWGDNVLKEMETRGHGIGLHADQGGSKKQSFEEFNRKVGEMKKQLESLDVTVRHVSGVSSDKDWVKVCIDNGFEAVTGVVSYSLWSLDESLRPVGFEPYASPKEGHAAYPWDPAMTIMPWRTSSGSDWIINDEAGKLIIIPSGLGLTAAYEEMNGLTEGGAGFEFDIKDIEAWRDKLDELLAYTDSNTVNTYYAAWSLGGPVDTDLLEKWLQMIDEYVRDGRIIWTNIPDMIDIYNAG
ncbi:MAG: hypothetical protein JXN65_04630 [Clostridia bacterium]|nr:hypothetical protein [Clostridia bacterium]